MPIKPVQIAIITGEASGDRVGAQLCAEIKRLRPDAQIWGSGGQFMRDAGAEVIVDLSRWGVIGVSAAIQLLPRILSARAHIQRELRKRPPDVLVPVDAGAFNVGFPLVEGLCSWTRRSLPQTKILYYFPPGSWRRTLRSTRLDTLADAVATPFEWSAQELTRLGAKATWVGHPLLDLVKPSQTASAFYKEYGLHPDHPVVGLLPGSRIQEIREITPLMFRAAAIIARRVPGVQFVLALAPTVDRADVVREWERVRKQRQTEPLSAAPDHSGGSGGHVHGGLPVAVPVGASGGASPQADDIARRQREWLQRAEEGGTGHNSGGGGSGDFPLVIVENKAYDVMAASDALLITSGTATLEAAILGKPMVITYRLSSHNPITLIEYAVVKKNLPEWIGMPNLLAQKKICPEFIQDAATPQALADEIIGLLLEPERMLVMRTDLRDAVALLGKPGGAARTAEMVLALADGAAFGNNDLPKGVENG